MKKFAFKTIVTLAVFATSTINYSVAAPEGFSTGPVFENYGENIVIEGGLNQAAKQKFKILFDVYKENESEGPHRGLNSIARFINMHLRAGVLLENIDIALVAHGKASYELMNNEAFDKKFGKENPSSDLLSQLLANKVKVFVCKSGCVQ